MIDKGTRLKVDIWLTMETCYSRRCFAALHNAAEPERYKA